MENFSIIVVEDVPLELKGTEGIIKNDIPEAHIIGSADSEKAYWKLIKTQWNKVFRGTTIGYADYETLKSGFRTTFLGIPIGKSK